jgi:hypothetical protein
MSAVQTSAPFDLDAHDPRPRAEEGVAMVLLDPRGRATAVTLQVRGTDCELYNALLQAHTRRRLERAPRKTTPAESEAEFYELHATLLAGWPAGTFQRKGQPFEYSPSNAAQLLRDYPYILEQVRRFADERANFLPGSASS